MAEKGRLKVTAILLSLIMVFALMPLGTGIVFAETDEDNASQSELQVDQNENDETNVQDNDAQKDTGESVDEVLNEDADSNAADKPDQVDAKAYDEYGNYYDDGEEDYNYEDDYDYDYEDDYYEDDYDWGDYYYPEVYLRVIGAQKVKVSWNSDSDLYYVWVYRKAAGAKSWSKVKKVYKKTATYWVDKGVKKNTKYYYCIRAYNYDGDSILSDYNVTKTRSNIGYLGSSEDYGYYGDVTYEQVKVWYSKGKLRCAIKLYNERYKKAKKFKYITIRIYHSNGKLIGKQTFKNVKMNLKPYKKKWKTFKFTYKNTYMHNVNLRYDADDYYMTYKITWK